MSLSNLLDPLDPISMPSLRMNERLVEDLWWNSGIYSPKHGLHDIFPIWNNFWTTSFLCKQLFVWKQWAVLKKNYLARIYNFLKKSAQFLLQIKISLWVSHCANFDGKNESTVRQCPPFLTKRWQEYIAET